MRFSRLSTLLLATALAPTGRPCGHARGRTHHHPPFNAAGGDGGAGGGTGPTPTGGAKDPGAGGGQEPPPKGDPPKEKTFTQAELDQIVQKRLRDLAGAVTQRDELAAKVAEYEKKAQEAEEAKLSATQRAELAQKREREEWAKKLEERDAAAKRERTMRHETLRSQKATSLTATLATKLYSERALPFVEQLLAQRLVVEDDGKGGERLMLRMGSAAADLEPVETGWPKLVDTELAPAFFKAQGGSGAQHGTGGSAGKGALPTDPTDRIAVGFGPRKT